MKKVLSFLLVFMLSLTVAGITQQSGAEAADATIYIHLFEHDGDYTNSGTGMSIGANWNNWADTADANGLITIELTDAQLAEMADSNFFKPVGDVNDPDNNQLAPGDGGVMLDISELRAGTKDVLHAYYVEGAKDFFIKDNDLNGLALFIYADPKIASEPDTYDGWGFHTWNNGDGGTSRPDYFDFPELDIDVEITTPTYENVPMRLGGVELDSTSQNSIGFIMHYGATSDVEDKACPTWENMAIDVEDIKPVDATTMGGASLQYYINGTCDFQDDYASFLSNFDIMYKDSLKNKFIEPTSIVNPNTIDVTFFSKKEAWQLLPGTFTVKDSEGTVLPIEDIVIPGAIEIGHYESVVEERAQTIVVLYVKSDVPADELGIVGNFTGWDGTNPALPVSTDDRGYYVYELATFGTEAQFGVLDKGNDGDDTTFSWGDKVSPNEGPGIEGGNIILDTSAGGTVHVFMDTADFLLVTDHQVGVDADLADYTYTADAACANNLVTVMLDTARPSTELGLVGALQSPNQWNPGEAIAPTGTTDEGVVYWEVCTTETTGGFKILQDAAASFDWGDTQVTPNDVTFTVETGVDNIAILDLNHTAALQPEYIYELTVYFLGLENAAEAGIIGSWQDPAFDVANPIIPTIQDGFGNWIIETEFYSKDDSFKVLVDTDANGLDAADATTETAYVIDLQGSDLNKIYAFDLSDDSLTAIGTTIEDEETTFTNFQLVMEDEFTHAAEYTVEYIEKAAVVCTQDDVDNEELDAEGVVCVLDAVKVPAEVIMWDLGFTTAVNFVETDVVEEVGTYAVSPTEITVQFTTIQDLFTMNDIIAVYDANDTMVTVDVEDYTLDLGAMEYAATVACDAPGNLVFLHLNAKTEIADLTHIGLVGSIQVANDWTPAEAINPTGMDSDGNYVFEVCLPETDTEVVFKVLHDEEADFDWGDSQLISSDVTMVVADGPHFYIEEGASQVNTSSTHKIMLNTDLDKTSSYYVALKDASGFTIKVDLLMDTQAPTVTATIDTSASFTIENTVTFDVNDYFTVLKFVDNREGELEFTIKTALDFSALGSQTMTIAASDMWGNEGTYDIVFTIVDTTDPELVIEASKEYEAGTEAPDWATFATSSDGTVTVDATDVNMDTAGVYYVNYTAEDAAGNQTLGTLEVTITAVESTGCFGSFSLGSSIGLIVAALAGGTVLFFVRKQK